jgi:hypothetical protein
VATKREVKIMGEKKAALSADGDNFKLDGSDFRILSGAIHYFR